MRGVPRSTILATMIAAVIGGPVFVQAEDNAPVMPGATVRVTLSEPKYGSLRESKSRVGALVSLSESEIALRSTHEGLPLVLERSGIEKYELKTRSGRRTAGALLGAGLGALSGFIYGAAIVGNTEDDPTDLFGMTALGNGALGAVLLALPGAAIGALVAPGEQWREFEPAQLRVGYIVGASGALGLQVSGTF